jgi:hypothetical protein
MGPCACPRVRAPVAAPRRCCTGRSARLRHRGAHISGAQNFAALALLPGARAHVGGAVGRWPLSAATGAPFWRAPSWCEGGAAQRFRLCMPPGSPTRSLQCCSRVAATVGKQGRLTRACCACATPPSVRARRRNTGPKALALMAAQHARHARSAAAAACKNARTRICRCLPVGRRGRRARIPKSGLTRRPPYGATQAAGPPQRSCRPRPRRVRSVRHAAASLQ